MQWLELRITGASSWDTSKPDGTPKKQLDVSRMAKLSWQSSIPFVEGLKNCGTFRQDFSEQLARL